MKLLLAWVLALLVFLSGSARAASDADVTLLKVTKVVIEEGVITIVVAEARTQITLIRDGHDPNSPGIRGTECPLPESRSYPTNPPSRSSGSSVRSQKV
jgi:hypothetical protein